MTNGLYGASATSFPSISILPPCGRSEPVVVGQVADLVHVLPDVLHDGDLLLMMGAGDIGYIAHRIATDGFAGSGEQA